MVPAGPPVPPAARRPRRETSGALQTCSTPPGRPRGREGADCGPPPAFFPAEDSLTLQHVDEGVPARGHRLPDVCRWLQGKVQEHGGGLGPYGRLNPHRLSGNDSDLDPVAVDGGNVLSLHLLILGFHPAGLKGRQDCMNGTLEILGKSGFSLV